MHPYSKHGLNKVDTYQSTKHFNNITVNHLNNYGLHLNKQGTSALAKNIKEFLNKD